MGMRGWLGLTGVRLWGLLAGQPLWGARALAPPLPCNLDSPGQRERFGAAWKPPHSGAWNPLTSDCSQGPRSVHTVRA